jgi:hypothetical protein
VRLIKIEDTWVNPDAVTFVRHADENDEGFLTEVFAGGVTQLFRASPEIVANLLMRAPSRDF